MLVMIRSAGSAVFLAVAMVATVACSGAADPGAIASVAGDGGDGGHSVETGDAAETGDVAPSSTRPASDGSDRYVATDGDDDGPGTYEQPWRTIRHAVSLAAPGMTIYVRAGRYEEYTDEHAGVRAAHSGRPDAWITLRNHPGERPIIAGNAASTIQFFGSSYWEVRGFELVGTGGGVGSGIGIGNRSHSIRIVDNWVHNFPGGGIETYRVSRITIDSNWVWENSFDAPRQTSGISMYQSVGIDGRIHPSGFENVIQNNVVFRNENKVVGPAGEVTDGNCIIIDDGRHTQVGSTEPPYQGRTLIENNVCVDNGGRGIHVYLSDNVAVVNNTLISNARHPAIDQGELSAIRASNVTFRNNAVRSLDGVDPKKVADAENITFEHNVYAGTGPQSLTETELVVQTLGLRNPGLDPSSSDYTPYPSSPLIGAGTAEGAPSIDVVGKERATPPTIGAHE